VSRAKHQDVAVLALTDHDTVAGLSRAKVQSVIEDLDLIFGIEFSCQWRGCNIHVVGLNIDICSSALLLAVEQQMERRRTRARLIDQKLQSRGVEGSLAGAQALAGDAVIGRPHFAAFLVAQGYCKSVQQAFNKYLGVGKVGDIKQIWPGFNDIIDIVRDAGGVAVLAHPCKYSMTHTKLCTMVADFKDAGGSAIEVVSGTQPPQVTRGLAAVADKYQLLGSCGSDFHLPGKPWQELGRFSPFPDNVQPVWTAWEQ